MHPGADMPTEFDAATCYQRLYESTGGPYWGVIVAGRTGDSFEARLTELWGPDNRRLEEAIVGCRETGTTLEAAIDTLKKTARAWIACRV